VGVGRGSLGLLFSGFARVKESTLDDGELGNFILFATKDCEQGKKDKRNPVSFLSLRLGDENWKIGVNMELSSRTGLVGEGEVATAAMVPLFDTLRSLKWKILPTSSRCGGGWKFSPC